MPNPYVNKVQLSNGTTLIDISDTTAVASDVASGKYFYTANGAKVQGSASSGGGETPTPVEEVAVRFIDYDGTVLHEYTKTEFSALNALPANPSHTGLTAQGWNWSKSEITSYLTKYLDAEITVGQMYITSSGATEVDITLTPKTLSLSLYLGLIGASISVNWGDGTNPSTMSVTGSSVTYRFLDHTYAAVGSYTISITVLSGSIVIRSSSSTAPTLLRGFSNSTSLDRSYIQRVTAVRLGNSCSFYNYGARFFDNLTYVTIPRNNVSAKRTYVFAQCPSLKAITIPAGETDVGSQAFYYDYRLTHISIPPSVTTFGSQSFTNNYSLNSIVFPDGVTSIVGSAFVYCTSIKRVIIPDGVTSIGEGVFGYEHSLKSARLPSSLTGIAKNAFTNCTALESISIPSNVTAIGDSIFYTCSKIQSITIPSGVQIIPETAFSYCYGLETVNFPNGLTTIAKSAFNACRNLKNVTLPNTVTSIGETAFQSCYSLTEISIPSGVTSLSRGLFAACDCLKSVSIPNSVTSIEDQVFSGCCSLPSIQLPNGLVSIGATAFFNCYCLETINIPSTVTSIGSQAFSGCRALKSIDIPSGVTSIADSAYYQCEAAVSVTIPNTVTSIGSQAFYNCFNLAVVTIPSSVTSIAANAFYGCYSLELHMLSTTPPTLANTNAFSSVPATNVIYVPRGYLNTYKNATNWSTYASRMQEEPA